MKSLAYDWLHHTYATDMGINRKYYLYLNVMSHMKNSGSKLIYFGINFVCIHEHYHHAKYILNCFLNVLLSVNYKYDMAEVAIFRAHQSHVKKLVSKTWYHSIFITQ